jgi:hypothetical protein
LGAFAALFTQPVWHHVQVLWIGAVLCRGSRAVASVSRVMGLGGERQFERLFNRVKQLRRIATLYEKLDCRYDTMFTLAAILIWLA